MTNGRGLGDAYCVTLDRIKAEAKTRDGGFNVDLSIGTANGGGRAMPRPWGTNRVYRLQP